LGVALNDFASRADLPNGKPPRVILIQPHTSVWTENDQNAVWQRQDDKCSIDRAFNAPLAQRNTVGQPVAPLIAPSSLWRVAPNDEISRQEHPHLGEVRTVLGIYHPAYSEDGRSALVPMYFLWSRHDAYALYVLDRTKQGWVVRCSRLDFFL
jgi:hypothetical protein